MFRRLSFVVVAALCCAMSPAPKPKVATAVAIDVSGPMTLLVRVAGHHFKPTLVDDSLLTWPHDPVSLVTITKVGKAVGSITPVTLP